MPHRNNDSIIGCGLYINIIRREGESQGEVGA